MAVVDQEPAVATGLDFLWLEITGKCNLTCGHCYADSGPLGDLHGDMSFEDWVRVLDEAADLGCRQVQFIGGEPALHPRLADLVGHARQAGFAFIEVFTNATRLNPTLVGCFREHRVRVATSFYSDEPDVHDRITRGPGSWHRTVAGIRQVLEAGLPLRVGVIEVGENDGHGPRATSFLQSLGVTDVGFDRLRRVGRGQTIPLGEPAEHLEELCGQCWKGKLCVVPSGEVFPCVFARATPLGDARDGLAAVLATARLRAFREAVRALERRRLEAGEAGHSPHASCAPTSCNPGQWCNPYQCTPQSGPCQPACNPVSCQPGTGPCYPAGK
jgi:MoaA/NifB/PqqE/SkfB family radical SAM enzyme